VTTTRFVTIDRALARKLAGLPDRLATDVRPTPRTDRQRAESKGHRWELLARKAFEAAGCRVEAAPKVLVWLPPKGALPGKCGACGHQRDARIPRSMRHDFFGVWDFIAVEASGILRMVQVTGETGLGDHRRKILASGWPARADDMLLAYIGRARFAVYHGPTFEHRTGELRAPSKPKARRA
jgi:hypothetical protein